MKKSINLLATILFTGVLLFSTSCSKKDNIAPAPVLPTASQWTFDGVTYNPTSSGGYINSFNYFVLDGRGKGQCQIDIFFSSSAPAAGEYTVKTASSSINSGLGLNQCYILVETTSETVLYSQGSANSAVKVTISGGKVIATLNNVVVSNNPSSAIPNTKTVSGTLVQTPAAVII